ncbi:putative soluble lytic murein transglycosylase [Halobacteriovorax marinus SJ]|uniref:Soluble lytic murein transglycosylase n=1 Tax=Halobacteriovorax marinus (strain ATCC BAA-682 / DSM 15412 / SJ) TaxID=862908 RepID=E1X177_HALMS|nr:lytic transglycosylase domain-containing protein [Halobacteriovorax marinus]CBW28147.1 putative soluble lytic murein transglycosylase [Halobacteriovorax marinus SJ]
MLRLATVTALTFLSLNTFAASATAQPFSIKTSRADEKFARSFHQFYKNIKRTKLHYNSISHMGRWIKHSQAFAEYSPLVDTLLKFKKAKLSTSEFHSVCKPKNFDSKDYPDLVKRSYTHLDHYCHWKFLKNTTKSKTKKSISFKNLEYFKYALPFYLKGKNKTEFATYLSRIDKNSNLHQLVSDLMTEQYLEKQFKPNSDHLKFIKINNQLTSYVQSAGLNDSSERNYFTKAFYEIRSNIKKHLADEELDLAYQMGHQLVSFYDSNKQYVNSDKAWINILTTGKNFLYRQEVEKARYFFEYALTMATNDQLDETIFQLLWSDILTGKYKKAVKTIEKFQLIKNYSKYNSKVKFWIAYTLYKNGESELSKHLFTTLTESSPLNFYAIISYKKLLDIFDVEDKEKLLGKYTEEIKPNVPANKKFSKNFISSLKRLSLWLELNLDAFSNNEISEIISRDSLYVFKNKAVAKNVENKELRKYLIEKLVSLFTKEKKYLHSFKLVHNSLENEVFELDAFTLKNLFPFQYLQKIKKIDKTIDPLVVISLIRQESAFNPSARSHVGARGLMQLMPATARQYKKNVRTSHLKRPDVNIKIGITYLKKLLKKYDGNLIYTLAAYNAGESRVKRWKKNIFINDDPMVTIESIPFRETRKYVKLIYRNIFFYNLLSNKTVLEKSLEDSFYVSLNTKR